VRLWLGALHLRDGTELAVREHPRGPVELLRAGARTAVPDATILITVSKIAKHRVFFVLPADLLNTFGVAPEPGSGDSLDLTSDATRINFA